MITRINHQGNLLLLHWKILLIPLLLLQVVATARAVDIIAVLPDRSTAYPNGVHNGLLLTARRLNLTLQVRTVGNFDPLLFAQVLQELIDLPREQQPSVYCIWPIDYPSRQFLADLYETHGIPIVQMNQLPETNGSWEWDHLLGYAGPDDALRATNAAIMMQQALLTSSSSSSSLPKSLPHKHIVALGYPDSYGGYHLSIDAFASTLTQFNKQNQLKNATLQPQFQLVQKIPLDWGTQPAYDATLKLLDDMLMTMQTQQSQDAEQANDHIIHGIYAMDDYILMGAYQAIQDHPLQRQFPSTRIVLVGTVCNGARQLLEQGDQYGTTVQSPYLEGDLAIRAAAEYLELGYLRSPFIRFTPNPILTAEMWTTQSDSNDTSSVFIDFQGQSYTVDELCTWSLHYERVAGITDETAKVVNNVCGIIKCSYIPQALLLAGFVLCGINYLLAIFSGICLYIYRNQNIIQLAQPFFLNLVIVGTMVDNTSIILMSRDNQNDSTSRQSLDASCFAFPWVLALGHMMTTATLVAKIYRVKKLIGGVNDNSTSGTVMGKVKVTIAEVAYFIVIFMSVDAVLLTVWSIVDPLQWHIKVSAYDANGFIAQASGQCSTEKANSYWFPLTIAIFHLGTLIYANVLAYQTIDYHKISDSKPVAIALFNSIQLLIIVTPLLVVVDNNVATSYFIRVCFVFLNNFGVLVLVVVPKIVRCMQGKGNVVPDIHRMTRRASDRTKASVGGNGRGNMVHFSGPSRMIDESSRGGGGGGRRESKIRYTGMSLSSGISEELQMEQSVQPWNETVSPPLQRGTTSLVEEPAVHNNNALSCGSTIISSGQWTQSEIILLSQVSKPVFVDKVDPTGGDNDDQEETDSKVLSVSFHFADDDDNDDKNYQVSQLGEDAVPPIQQMTDRRAETALDVPITPPRAPTEAKSSTEEMNEASTVAAAPTDTEKDQGSTSQPKNTADNSSTSGTDRQESQLGFESTHQRPLKVLDDDGVEVEMDVEVEPQDEFFLGAILASRLLPSSPARVKPPPPPTTNNDVTAPTETQVERNNDDGGDGDGAGAGAGAGTA